jgi:monoamine oxidase
MKSAKSSNPASGHKSKGSVVVLGGGAAGLSAALDLAETHSVTILEARDRLGGRIHTIRSSNGIPVELGAEFVHGRPPQLMGLIKSGGFKTHEPPDRHFKEAFGELIELPDFWDQLSAITANIKKHGRDTSFLEILDRDRAPHESKELARGFVEGFHGAAVENASAKEILLSEESSEKIDGQKNLRLEAGYLQIVDLLADQCRQRGVQIHTSSQAVAIEWINRPATILLKSKEKITADYIVITLPVGVLRSGSIRFDPEPKEKLEAIHAIQPGSVTKLIFHFREQFWRERNFGFIHSSDQWFPTWWSDQRGDILTAWAGGPQGKALADQSEDFIIHRGLETAARIFGETLPRLKNILLSAYTHNWSHDPFSRGAYSYLPVGAIDAPKILAQPESGVLFFAGEATDLTHQLGTVHGAIATGQRAARDIKSCG